MGRKADENFKYYLMGSTSMNMEYSDVKCHLMNSGELAQEVLQEK